MILYHTGDREVRDPDIRYGRKNADFGWGFYLTPDRDFTFRWARENAVVNEYELDETGLLIRRFSRDTEWFRYIFQNRRAHDTLDADVVIGPIANDTIFDTLGIISSGLISPEDAVKLLRIGPEYTQVAVKTEKAVSRLRWIRAEKIGPVSEDILKDEENAFQTAFEKALAEIAE